ncbi:hypothetical protein BS47DRAFT_1481304 [Hydnum rufescens UP504]|uniref:Uncharacterized protein n=1 Tax=Hydnum rufescens UP504 TaxID=1448309 RepID=A0A9P6BBT8_9AGAM|nr:hypothetical protein BS47DRAFT_1481304 [Hydnum rufescens UP504]
MSLLAKFSRSQTPPVNDLPPPADNDRFKSSKPPTSGPRGATLPKSFTLPSYLPSAPLASAPNLAGRRKQPPNLDYINYLCLQPDLVLLNRKPSETPPVEVSLAPTPAPSGLRNIFTRSQTPQLQGSQQMASISNNIHKDIGTMETQSRSTKEREVQTASSSGANGLPPPPPGKDDVGPSILQKGPSQMHGHAANTAATERKRTGSTWGSYLMPPKSSEKRERSTPNTDVRLENHPQTIPLRLKPSSRDLQSQYERSKPSLPTAVANTQSVSLRAPTQPAHGPQILVQQSQSTPLVPASRAPREPRETKPSKVYADRSSAEHPDHPSVVEVVSRQSSRNTMTTTYVTAKSSQAQAIPLASAPSHHNHSYISPLNATTEYTESSPGRESLLTPSSLAASYPLPSEASPPAHQQPVLYNPSKPLPPIVRSPAPPPSLPLQNHRSKDTLHDNIKIPQDEKHEVKLDTQINPPSPPLSLQVSSSSTPSSHQSSPTSSFHSIQSTVEFSQPPASDARPPVITLHPSEKSNKASPSGTSSSTSIMPQSPAGLGNPHVTMTSVLVSNIGSCFHWLCSSTRGISCTNLTSAIACYYIASSGSQGISEAQGVSIPTISFPSYSRPSTTSRGYCAFCFSGSIVIANVTPAPMIPSFPLSPPMTSPRIVTSPTAVIGGSAKSRVTPKSIPLPASTLASPSPAPIIELEPTPTPVRVQSPIATSLPIVASPPVATSPMVASPPTANGLAKARLLPRAASLPMHVPSDSGPTLATETVPARISPVQSPTPRAVSMVKSPPLPASPLESSGLGKSRAPAAFPSLQKSSPVSSDPVAASEPAPPRVSPSHSPIMTLPPTMGSPPTVTSPAAFAPLSPATGVPVVPVPIDEFENALALVFRSIGRGPVAMPPIEHAPDHDVLTSTFTTYAVESPADNSLRSAKSPIFGAPELGIGSLLTSPAQDLTMHSTPGSPSVASPFVAPQTRLSDVPLTPRESSARHLPTQKPLPSSPILSPHQAPPLFCLPLSELPSVLPRTAEIRTVGTVSSPSHMTFSQPLADSLFQVLSAGGVIGPAPSSVRDTSLALGPASILAQSPLNRTRPVPPPIPVRSPERRPSLPSRPSSPSPPPVLSPRPSHPQSPTLPRSPPQAISPPIISRPMPSTPKNVTPALVGKPSIIRAEAAPVPPSASPPPSRPPTPVSTQTNRPTPPSLLRPSSPPVIRSSSTPNLGESQPIPAKKEQASSFRFWRSSRSHSPAHLNVLSPPATPSIDVTPPVRPPTPFSWQSYDQSSHRPLRASTHSSRINDPSVPKSIPFGILESRKARSDAVFCFHGSNRFPNPDCSWFDDRWPSSRGPYEFSPPPSPPPVDSRVKNWFDGLDAVPQTLKVRKPGVTFEIDHTSSPVASMPVLMARENGCLSHSQKVRRIRTNCLLPTFFGKL